MSNRKQIHSKASDNHTEAGKHLSDRWRSRDGTFHGRWHFSFGDNYDPEHMQFGTLRVFNDDTLSPGAVWPLHPHSEIEVVTYCAEGEFRHADQHGKGGDP